MVVIKKFQTWAMVLCSLTTLTIAGCGGNGNPSSNGSQEVEFWTMQLQPKFNDYFTQLNQNFTQSHGNTEILWVDVPWSAMESKILTSVSAQTAPDVVNLNPSFASTLAGDGAWLDLDEQLSPESKSLYLPKVWKANVIDDVTFGLPWYITTRVTFFNQELLAQTSYQQPPQTFSELAAFAKELKEKTGKYALFVSFVPGDSGEVLESLVQMGVTLINDQELAAFNSPEGKAAFQFWVDLYQQQLLPPEVLTQGHQEAIALYQSGQVALLSAGPEFSNTIETNAPQIAANSGVAPQITGNTKKKAVAVMNLVIPKDTDQPQKALNYALFVTNDQNQLAFAKQAKVLPSTEKALTQLITELSTEKSEGFTAATLVSAKQLVDGEVLLPPIKNLNLLQKIIYENLQQAMLGEKTVDQAIADAETEWNNLVKK
ncbi:MAG: sugar ABC transporter substrate-binding protein [Synechococcaceae cyanobacterium RL_1_2]|nr:sugar ABC transporter substrate-binding protein [Synechococcaceae cyanobacterium RL_1_2]